MGEERKEEREVEGRKKRKGQGDKRKGGMINIKVPKNDLTGEYVPSPRSMKKASWSKQILQFNSMLLIS